MGSCDDLFFSSDFDSTYNDYGDSCAGRQEVGTGRTCNSAFG